MASIRLLRNVKKRTKLTKRYEKQVLGHHIQVDVKFLKLKGKKWQVYKEISVYSH